MCQVGNLAAWMQSHRKDEEDSKSIDRGIHVFLRLTLQLVSGSVRATIPPALHMQRPMHPICTYLPSLYLLRTGIHSSLTLAPK